MKTSSFFREYLWGAASCLIFLVFYIWNIPGVIAMRNTFLVLLFLITCLLGISRFREIRDFHGISWAPLLWLIALTFWMVLAILIWAIDPGLSWKEFTGQWLVSLFVAFTSGLLAIVAITETPERSTRLFLAIFYSLFVQVVLHILMDLWFWYETKSFPFRAAPVLHLLSVFQVDSLIDLFNEDGLDKFSYLNNILAAFLISESVQRIVYRRHWIISKKSLIIIGWLAVVICSYSLRMRNGNVGLMVLLLIAMLTAGFTQLRRIGPINAAAIGVCGIVLLASISIAMIQSDKRWTTFFRSVPIAWDTEQYRDWLHSKTPPVIEWDSTYLRVAWIKEGGKLIRNMPLGSGYNRNAFGDRIDSQYERNGMARGGHSHSGVIDFAIANGLVGISLWFGFIGSLFWIGSRSFRKNEMGAGLCLMFIIIGYFVRSLVDSNMRDHMLQEFLFLVSFLYIAASYRVNSELLREDINYKA